MSELIYNIRNIFSTTTGGCLEQHGCSAYWIPPYQRGYKWGSEDREPVWHLLNDLKQAWKSKAKEYLLQAITVKRVRDGQGGWVLEVIDGQQRLTTLLILLHAIDRRAGQPAGSNVATNKLRYSIRHEDRALDELVVDWMDGIGDCEEDFETFKKVTAVDEERQQDRYYLRCATLRCLDGLGSRSGDSGFQSAGGMVDIRRFVLEDVKLMVNSVEAHLSGETIFGNLNTNRVPLTEIELIKGLLLTRVARETAAIRPRTYREVLEMRIQLGRKWDELHHWTNRPEIKSMYFPASEDGMTSLLELVARQLPGFSPPPRGEKEDKKPLFEYFLRQPHFERVFRLMASTYSRLQDWHADGESYHLLGYCLMDKKPDSRLTFLAEQLSRRTKPELKKALHERRRSILCGGKTTNGDGDEAEDLDLGKLGYRENDTQLRAIFLALSVFQGTDRGRFDFHAFQEENWSLEHIFPQTPFGKNANLTDAERKAVLDLLVRNDEQVLTEETTEKLALLRDAGDVMDTEEIERLLKSEPRLHQIGNLCLLRPEDNAAIGCRMFREKRRVIRSRIAQGSFVPRHTYEVFSKMIVGEDDSLDVWSRQNIERHQDVIQERISVLLKEEA